MNKLKELEQRSLTFRVIEVILLVIFASIIVMQVIFPNVLYQAYLDVKVATDENYSLISEEYKLYASTKLTEAQEEIYLNYIEKASENLPLYMGDYNIIIAGDELDTLNPYTLSYKSEGYTITAHTSKQQRVITLHKNYIALSYHHEIGHAVDNTYNFSDSAEFKALYEKAEHNDYLNSDIMEYFADGYDRFLNRKMDRATEQELITYYESILNQEYAG